MERSTQHSLIQQAELYLQKPFRNGRLEWSIGPNVFSDDETWNVSGILY